MEGPFDINTSEEVSESIIEVIAHKLKGSMKYDWVKTILAIILQSTAFGYYLAGMNSDLAHLTKEFAEFKIGMAQKIEKLDELRESSTEAKIKLELLSNEVNKSSTLRDTYESKLQELRDQVRDTTREITNMKQFRPSTK